MIYYAALDDGYIRKSIRNGSLAIFENIEDAYKLCRKLKCEAIEVSVVKKETYDELERFFVDIFKDFSEIEVESMPPSIKLAWYRGKKLYMKHKQEISHENE